MTARGKDSNGSADGLSVVGVTLEFSGKTWDINRDKVIDAFDKAPTGAVLGPRARWFVEFDGDMRSMLEVFKVIVPMKDDQVTVEMLELFAGAVESMGFSVLDRMGHHQL